MVCVQRGPNILPGLNGKEFFFSGRLYYLYQKVQCGAIVCCTTSSLL